MTQHEETTMEDNENGARDTLADDQAYRMTGSPPGDENASHDVATRDTVHSEHASPGADDRDDMPEAGRDTMGGSAEDDAEADLAEVRNPHAPNGSIRHQAAPGERPEDHTALVEDSDSERFRSRWHDVQAAFVDDPQRAVQDADQLVAELMRTLAATFAERKQSLEGQWHKGGDAETEDLRLALRGYRSFFDQLLPH